MLISIKQLPGTVDVETEKTHDLFDFMRQVTVDMAIEYERIQKRASEDPGTAGDQGEENWAELLRGWLPPTYEVVTKGRIISHDGRISPQIDVIVLRSVYPEKLLTKKLYLAAGVAAAFECKTTLKASHIEKAMENCVKIKSLYEAREGTPYRELHAPIVYGLLAHSHSWKGDNSTPLSNIEKKLHEYDSQYVSHPRFCLDMICVADLSAWTLHHRYLIIGDDAVTLYLRRTGPNNSIDGDYTPIGSTISNLWLRLAWEDPVLRNLAIYYRQTGIGGDGIGFVRNWDINSIHTRNLLSQIKYRATAGGEVNNWSEWNICFG